MTVRTKTRVRTLYRQNRERRRASAPLLRALRRCSKGAPAPPRLRGDQHGARGRWRASVGFLRPTRHLPTTSFAGPTRGSLRARPECTRPVLIWRGGSGQLVSFCVAPGTQSAPEPNCPMPRTQFLRRRLTAARERCGARRVATSALCGAAAGFGAARAGSARSAQFHRRRTLDSDNAAGSANAAAPAASGPRRPTHCSSLLRRRRRWRFRSPRPAPGPLASSTAVQRRVASGDVRPWAAARRAAALR